MTQEERRIFLIKELLREEIRYKGTDIPDDEAGQRDLLRSLMNVREPKEIDDEFLRVQDEYLLERAREKGVVDARGLTPVKSDPRIVLWQGDMTRLKADAIVNPANAQMLGCFRPLHSCLDNLIHTYAGVQLRLACDRQMKAIRARLGEKYEQPTAIPMITDAYNLPADKIVHVVGPIVQGELTDRHKEQLAACYKNTLALCEKRGLTNVAFCCISTGVFSFPHEAAAQIAYRAVKETLDACKSVKRVIFNVFTDEDYEIYCALLGARSSSGERMRWLK